MLYRTDRERLQKIVCEETAILTEIQAAYEQGTRDLALVTDAVDALAKRMYDVADRLSARIQALEDRGA